MRRNGNGEPAVDQGVVDGFPVTFNPDTGQFYVHAQGTRDGTNILSAGRDWRNIVQSAHRLKGV
jgi:hypothetical protein